MAKECPVCRLINPDIAQRCDCGFDFQSRRVEASYANPRDPEILAERGMTVAEVGVRNLKQGLPQLIGALIVLVLGVAAFSSNPGASEAPLYAVVAIVSATGLVARGVGQYRRGRRMSKRG
jgi:hypothetical protein